MDKNQITLASIAFILGFGAGRIPTPTLDFAGKVAGPAVVDKCLAPFASTADASGKIACIVTGVHVSKWSPSNPKDDNELTSLWVCNGAVPQDQDCLTAIAGERELGTAIVFTGAQTDKGLEFKAEVRTVGEAKEVEKLP